MALQTMNPSALASPQQQILRPPLRRAVYVHVSDLTSAYNIDHKKLHNELARVKDEQTKQALVPSSNDDPAVVEDQSIASLPQKRLQPPRGGYNLCVLVGNVTVVVDKLRVDRSRVRLAEVEVGDETGVVSLRARDGQIDLLREISERAGAVVLRNCNLELFQGKHIRLAITKWGKISTYPDEVPSTPPPPTKINRERAFSLIDLSLVASEMVENRPPDSPYQNQSREATGTDRKQGQGRQYASPYQHQNQSYRQRGSRTHQRQQRQHQQQAQSQTQHRGSPGLGSPLLMPFPAVQSSSLAGTQFATMQAFQPRYGREGSFYPQTQPHQQQQRSAQEGLQQPHLLLQQHYELQQRQLLQAYHDQHQQHQGRQRTVQLGGQGFDTQQQEYSSSQQSLSQSPLLQGGHMPSSSSGESPDRHRTTSTHNMLSELGQSPEGVISTEGSQVHFGTEPPLTTDSGFLRVDQHEATDSSMKSPAVTAWAGQQSGFQPSFDDQSPGRMNPGARAFAPSYPHQIRPGFQTGYLYPTYGQQQQSHQHHQGHQVYGAYAQQNPSAYPPLPSPEHTRSSKGQPKGQPRGKEPQQSKASRPKS